MRGRILVVGLGRFGTSLAMKLSDLGYQVTAVDLDMSAVEVVRSKVAYAIELDATDPEALQSIDLTIADPPIDEIIDTVFQQPDIPVPDAPPELALR